VLYSARNPQRHRGSAVRRLVAVRRHWSGYQVALRKVGVRYQGAGTMLDLIIKATR
jgi:hypothetical protein